MSVANAEDFWHGQDERCNQQNAGAIAKPINQPTGSDPGVGRHVSGIESQCPQGCADQSTSKGSQDQQPDGVTQPRHGSVKSDNSGEKKCARERGESCRDGLTESDGGTDRAQEGNQESAGCYR